MKINIRLDQIVALLDEHGFLTVAEISRMCNVSEMTVRRDLDLLNTQARIQRTYGGAVPLNNKTRTGEAGSSIPDQKSGVLLVDQVDVLIATSVNPYFDQLMIEKAKKKNIPLIAESIEMPSQATIVTVDNFKAGFDLGSWAGTFLNQKGIKRAYLLDLTFTKPNTQDSLRGLTKPNPKVRPSSQSTLIPVMPLLTSLQEMPWQCIRRSI